MTSVICFRLNGCYTRISTPPGERGDPAFIGLSTRINRQSSRLAWSTERLPGLARATQRDLVSNLTPFKGEKKKKPNETRGFVGFLSFFPPV